MAATKRNRSKHGDPKHEEIRNKIKVSQLITRLQNNVLGGLKKEMTTGQIAAARILLDKAVPNLQSTEIKAKVETEQPWIGPKPLTEAGWEAKHGEETKH